MIFTLGLPLKVATIILGCILSIDLTLFNALGPISIPTPPTVALTEFFHADTVASVHPSPVSWYLISSLCMYLCYCMHIMSVLCSTADEVISSSWPIILFKALSLNLVIFIVCLHFRSFCCLSSIADFSNTEPMAPTSARRAPFFTRVKNDAVYVCGLCVGHGYFRWLFLFLFSSIEATHRLAAVVLRLNWRSWGLSNETDSCRIRLGIAFGRQRVYSHTFTTIMLLPMCIFKKWAFLFQ